MPLPFARSAAVVRPTFSRDFAGLKTLDHGAGPAITFTRASNATFFDANGVLQTAANNVPRFDHDPATGASRGLLIEESRSNRITYSEDFGNAAWVKTGGRVVITTDQIVAPDGNSTADFAEANGGASNSRLIQQTDVASSTGKSLSIFAKAGTASFLQLLFGADTASWANFDLSGGTVGSTGTVLSATITPVGNGWHRCQVTTSSTTATNATFAIVTSGAAGRAEANTLSTGLYIWGAQLEAGAFPTSYIPTTAAAATRSADSAVVTPISSFYNQSEGTLFAEASNNNTTASAFPLLAQIATDNNSRIALSRNNADNAGRFSVTDNSVAQVGANIGSWTLGNLAKLIAAYKINDFAGTVNGASVTIDTLGTVPSATTLNIGSNFVLTGQLGGHIRKIAYYPRRLSNALLQQLTT